jgi:hypothetical protein
MNPLPVFAIKAHGLNKEKGEPDALMAINSKTRSLPIYLRETMPVQPMAAK